MKEKHKKLLNEFKKLEEEIYSTRQAGNIDANQKQLDGETIEELLQQYENGVRECVRVFGPEIKEYLKA